MTFVLTLFLLVCIVITLTIVADYNRQQIKKKKVISTKGTAPEVPEKKKRGRPKKQLLK